MFFVVFADAIHKNADPSSTIIALIAMVVMSVSFTFKADLEADMRGKKALAADHA